MYWMSITKNINGINKLTVHCFKLLALSDKSYWIGYRSSSNACIAEIATPSCIIVRKQPQQKGRLLDEDSGFYWLHPQCHKCSSGWEVLRPLEGFLGHPEPRVSWSSRTQTDMYPYRAHTCQSGLYNYYNYRTVYKIPTRQFRVGKV